MSDPRRHPRLPLGRLHSLDRDLDYIAPLLDQPLWVRIVVAMVLGIGLGLAVSPQGGALLGAETATALAAWLKLPGSIFLNLIQMVVIPLVLTSIILGIASSGGGDHLRRVGLRILPYFVTTTVIAVTLGALLAGLIQPGQYIDTGFLASMEPVAATAAPVATLEQQSLPEKIANLIPTNIDQAILSKDMLQVVIYAIFFGVAIVSLPAKRSAPLMAVIEGVQDACLKLIGWAMLLAPVAVFGLMADIAIRVGVDALLGMSAYVGTVLLGLLCLVLVYLLIVTVLARRSPLAFLVAVRDAQLLAFSTSSSASVMPLSMQTAEEKLGVKPSISKFIVPLGATVNMDGTALYQVVAALFLAQVYGIDLSTGQTILLIATTVGASIGSPSTPGVGIVILATILTDIGVPASGIALIIGVDRVLDMCRTTVNVTGDLAACTVMDKWLSEPELEERSEAQALGVAEGERG